MNFTIQGASAGSGNLYARPDASSTQSLMAVYTNNSSEYTSNTGIVALGSDGTIQVMTTTTARVIADVQGYYTTNTDGTAPGGFVPLAGSRIVDTRSGLGAPKAVLTPGSSIDVQVGGTSGVPADASAVVVNLVPISSGTTDGYLRPYPTGDTPPSTALHYAPSSTSSIQAQVALSTDGRMTIANPAGTANLAIDIQGYFTAAGKNGATFTPAAGRIYDSRTSGNTIFAKSETRSVQIAGNGAVPVMNSGIVAVVLSLTAVNSPTDGRAIAWADGTTKPATTALNFRAGEVRTNTVTVPLGANGKISLQNVADPTNYAIDVQGWYINRAQPGISCPYADDSTNLNIPSADFQCTVTAPPSGGTNEALHVTVDGDAMSDFTTSAVAGTTAKATVAAHGGDHQISAEVLDADGNSLVSTSYSFHLGGDWAHEAMTTLPADNSYASTGTWLSVDSTRDIFSDDATETYTLSANPDGSSSPLATSDPISGAFLIPEGVLQDGQKYFWKATVAGTSAGAWATVTTPVHTFTATAAKVNNRCAAALQAVTDPSSLSRADYENTCQGDDSQDPGVAPDPDDLGITFDTSSSDTSSTQAVTRSTSTIRSTTGTADAHAPAYNWKSIMRGKWYYDGTSAWSTKKYRGKVGYQRCNDDGSYGIAADIEVTKCGNYSPKGKDILYESVKVNYVFRGSPFYYTGSFHMTVTKSGKTSAGTGRGF